MFLFLNQLMALKLLLTLAVSLLQRHTIVLDLSLVGWLIDSRTFLGHIFCFIKLSSAGKFLLFVLNLGRKNRRPTTVSLS